MFSRLPWVSSQAATASPGGEIATRGNRASSVSGVSVTGSPQAVVASGRTELWMNVLNVRIFPKETVHTATALPARLIATAGSDGLLPSGVVRTRTGSCHDVAALARDALSTMFAAPLRPAQTATASPCESMANPWVLTCSPPDDTSTGAPHVAVAARRVALLSTSSRVHVTVALPCASIAAPGGSALGPASADVDRVAAPLHVPEDAKRTAACATLKFSPSKPCQVATASPRGLAATVGSSALSPAAESWTGACHLPATGRTELATASAGLASPMATASPWEADDVLRRAP